MSVKQVFSIGPYLPLTGRSLNLGTTKGSLINILFYNLCIYYVFIRIINIRQVMGPGTFFATLV